MKKSIKDYMTALPQTIGVDGNLHLAKFLMDENVLPSFITGIQNQIRANL